MKTLKIIESIKNFLDVGVIIESLNNARKRRFEMEYEKNPLLVRYLVSFSQTDPSMSLTADGLNNFMERR